jgi:hypothetical protein
LQPLAERSTRPPQPSEEEEDDSERKGDESSPPETVASRELPALRDMPGITFSLQLLRFARRFRAVDVF